MPLTLNTMKIKEEIKIIEKEINDIEVAIACDDSVSSMSFAFSQAEIRLKYLKKSLRIANLRLAQGLLI